MATRSKPYGSPGWPRRQRSSNHQRIARAIAIAAALWTAAVGSAAVLPIAFEPNRGQASGDFVARGSGMTVALQSDRVEFIGRGSRVVTTLNGARHGVRPEPEQRLPGVTHYLKGNDRSRWITDIPNYGRLRYRGIYPGIDAIYYGKDGRLEYDFVVAPGADPRRIVLHYAGGSARVDASGDLVLGTLRQHRPVVYQVIGGQRRDVAARYALRGQTVRFELGAYDRSRELVIDPAVTWATYVGSSGSDG